MAEECQKKSHECETTNVEATDRGMFDFLGKKEEKEQEAVIVTECETVYVSESEEKMEEEKPSLIEKLHRSHSSSSSSSDEEEVEEGVEKKQKKKGLKEKISGEKKEEHKDTFVPIEKCDDFAYGDATHPEEKKGFLEKIKDKLPGQHKKPEEVTPAPVLAPAPVECSGGGHAYEGEAKEKKGILEKIKEKLPGHHKCEEEKEKECGTH